MQRRRAGCFVSMPDARPSKGAYATAQAATVSPQPRRRPTAPSATPALRQLTQSLRAAAGNQGPPSRHGGLALRVVPLTAAGWSPLAPPPKPPNESPPGVGTNAATTSRMDGLGLLRSGPGSPGGGNRGRQGSKSHPILPEMRRSWIGFGWISLGERKWISLGERYRSTLSC